MLFINYHLNSSIADKHKFVPWRKEHYAWEQTNFGKEFVIDFFYF
jgi:hypothetical protein